MYAFEIFKVKSDYRLSVAAAWGLNALVLMANWRTATWSGSYMDLVPEVFGSTTTAKKAIAELAAAGQVEIDKPFVQNGEGVLFIAAYPDLVKLSEGHWERILQKRRGFPQVCVNGGTGQCPHPDCGEPAGASCDHCKVF